MVVEADALHHPEERENVLVAACDPTSDGSLTANIVSAGLVQTSTNSTRPESVVPKNDFRTAGNAGTIRLRPICAVKAGRSANFQFITTSGQHTQRRRRLAEMLLVVAGFGPLSGGWLVLIEARYASTSVTSPMGRGSEGSSRYCTWIPSVRSAKLRKSEQVRAPESQRSRRRCVRRRGLCVRRDELKFSGASCGKS